MTKVTLSDVANISGAESAAIGVLNANSDLITTAIENTLSRDGTAPNSMAADLDMDNNDILNVDNIDVNAITIDGVPVTIDDTIYASGSEAGVQSFKYDFNTVALLLADTVRAYSNTTEGDYIRTRSEGFAYEVAASGASDHHVTTGGGLKLYIVGDVVTPEHFGTIGAGADDDAIMTKFFALLVAGRKGVARGAYTLDSGIAVTATANMHLDFEGATFTSVSASSISEMLYIEMANFNLAAKMGTWDADQNTVKCCHVRNSSTGKPDLWISGTFQNPKLKSTSPLVSSNGLYVAGSFDKVYIEPIVKNVTRDAGITGGVCQGIVYTYLTSPDRNARSVIINRPHIETVTTADSPASALCQDCDGIVLFQLDEDGQRAAVIDGTFKDCQGRDVKTYARGARVIRPSSYRGINGKYGGSVNYAFLGGDGDLIDAKLRFEGAAHQYGTTIASFYTSVARSEGWGLKKVSGMNIHDLSTGTEKITELVDLTVANGLSADQGKQNAEVTGLVVQGKAISNILGVRNFGGITGEGRVSVTGFYGEIATSVASCDTTYLPNITGILKNIKNTGTEVPVITKAGGGSLGNVWGKWYGDETVEGVARNFGLTSGTPGWVLGSSKITENNTSYFGGMIPLYAHSTMPNGAQVSFDVGDPKGGALLILKVLSRIIVLKTNAGENTFVAITPIEPSWYEVDQTGAEPTTAGRFRIWKTNSGQTLNFKNSLGGAYLVTIQAIL